MVPLGGILTGVGCFGMLAMLPHLIMPKKMCQMFLADKWTDSETSQKQLILLHFGCFANLFFLALTVAVMGQTCPCIPAAFFFAFIIATRIVHVALGLKGPGS